MTTIERLVARINPATGWNYIMELVQYIENLDHSKFHHKWTDLEGERSNFEGYEVRISGNYCEIICHLALDPPNVIVGYSAKTKKEAVIKALHKFSEYVSTQRQSD